MNKRRYGYEGEDFLKSSEVIAELESILMNHDVLNFEEWKDAWESSDSIGGREKPSRVSILKKILISNYPTPNKLEKVNKLLNLMGYAKLYPRNIPEAIIIYCINNNVDFSHCKKMIYDSNPFNSIDATGRAKEKEAFISKYNHELKEITYNSLKELYNQYIDINDNKTINITSAMERDLLQIKDEIQLNVWIREMDEKFKSARVSARYYITKYICMYIERYTDEYNKLAKEQYLKSKKYGKNYESSDFKKFDYSLYRNVRIAGKLINQSQFRNNINSYDLINNRISFDMVPINMAHFAHRIIDKFYCLGSLQSVLNAHEVNVDSFFDIDDKDEVELFKDEFRDNLEEYERKRILQLGNFQNENEILEYIDCGKDRINLYSIKEKIIDIINGKSDVSREFFIMFLISLNDDPTFELDSVLERVGFECLHHNSDNYNDKSPFDEYVYKIWKNEGDKNRTFLSYVYQEFWHHNYARLIERMPEDILTKTDSLNMREILEENYFGTKKR